MSRPGCGWRRAPERRAHEPRRRPTAAWPRPCGDVPDIACPRSECEPMRSTARIEPSRTMFRD
ncbi:hypothetical protein LA76x_4688 [Lysobacter antibioticus]|uniref:Uncharacterized protein n=1 Tax=Lysobacter antibioticus TaxID=84531 RepID=A0A0S2FH07_LYSAN|nr:hypothetical protein LA76x_4688 [Lysobacter antibioticus]